MKILAMSVWRFTTDATDPIRLAYVDDLSEFNFFTRRTVSEHLRFGARTVVQRTPKGARQTVEMKDNPFLIHTHVRTDGLCGVVVADKEYPQRVAYSLITKTCMEFEKASGGKWVSVQEDQLLEPPFMKTDLVKFQDPQNGDKLTKIQNDLDDIKEIMHKNIDEVLKRGENLDSLMEKSEDLSMTSVQFFKKAKKTNACCKY